MKRLAFWSVLALSVAGTGTTAYAQRLSNFCERQYDQYMNAPSPRAFVTGADGSCWWGYGQRDVRAAIAFAMNACTSKGRPGCRVYSSSN